MSVDCGAARYVATRAAVLFLSSAICVCGGERSVLAASQGAALRGSRQIGFIENQGQLPERFSFEAHFDELATLISSASITLVPVGSEATSDNRCRRPPGVEIFFGDIANSGGASGHGVIPGEISVFRGQVRERWIRKARSFEIVEFNGLYDNASISVTSSDGAPAFVICAADREALNGIVFRVESSVPGAPIRLSEENGGIVVDTECGLVQMPRLVAGKACDSGATADELGYRALGGQYLGAAARRTQIGRTGEEREAKFSTFLGGSGSDTAYGVSVGSDGRVYVVGTTASADFPSATEDVVGGNDVMVVELDAQGGLIRSIMLGGSGGLDIGRSIVATPAGELIIAGSTNSPDFPTAGIGTTIGFQGNSDAFVTKIAADGSLAWSRYLGSAGTDSASGVAIADRQVLVGGYTDSSILVEAETVVRQVGGGGGADGFGSWIDLDSGSILALTRFGGTRDDFVRSVTPTRVGMVLVGVTSSIDFPIAGSLQEFGGGQTDAFVTEIGAASSIAAFSTFIGGAGDDQARDVAANDADELAVVGWTRSTDFPIYRESIPAGQRLGQDAFVWSVGADRQARFTEVLGGSSSDLATSVVYLTEGIAVLGDTSSSDLPVRGAEDDVYSGGSSDVFLARIGASGELDSLRYFGGDGIDTVNGSASRADSIVFVGGTTSIRFPLLDPIQASNRGADAYVATDELGANPDLCMYAIPSHVPAILAQNLTSRATTVAAVVGGVPPGRPIGTFTSALSRRLFVGYEAADSTGAILTVDTTLHKIEGIVQLPLVPRLMSGSPDGSLLYLSDGAQIIRLNVRTGISETILGEDEEVVGGSAVDPQSGELLITNPVTSTLIGYRPDSREETFRVAFEPASRASGLAFVGDRKVAVALTGASRIAIVDLASAVAVASIVVSPLPKELRYDPSADTLFVVHSGNRFGSIDIVDVAASDVRYSIGLSYLPALLERIPRTPLVLVGPTEVGGLAIIDSTIGQIVDQVNLPMPAVAVGSFESVNGCGGTTPCTGDCNGDGRVVLNELIQGVRLAHGDDGSSCIGYWGHGVTIDSLVAAVQHALNDDCH